MEKGRLDWWLGSHGAATRDLRNHDSGRRLTRLSLLPACIIFHAVLSLSVSCFSVGWSTFLLPRLSAAGRGCQLSEEVRASGAVERWRNAHSRAVVEVKRLYVGEERSSGQQEQQTTQCSEARERLTITQGLRYVHDCFALLEEKTCQLDCVKKSSGELWKLNKAIRSNRQFESWKFALVYELC